MELPTSAIRSEEAGVAGGCLSDLETGGYGDLHSGRQRMGTSRYFYTSSHSLRIV